MPRQADPNQLWRDAERLVLALTRAYAAQVDRNQAARAGGALRCADEARATRLARLLQRAWRRRTRRAAHRLS